ncbi:MAG TPA: hypothetical protein VK550_17305 [Polyangiaceae bacterium]|nr:hypothetical protein [Polyangiaceae bacterium]
MARTLEIDDVAYAGLRELAERDHITLEEELAKLIEAARREASRHEEFFRDMERGCASMTPEEWADYGADVWDQTSGDGLEDEPPCPLDGDDPKKGAVRS